ncbi:MAG: N-acetyltransferase family protein [Mesorhizobium sp.]
MDITLRPAVPDDLDAITGIYAHAVQNGTASYELDTPSRTEMGERYRALVEKGYPYIVAEKDGGVIGYAYAGPFRPRRAYRFMVENSIYIAPHAQGLGVGPHLLARLIEDCTRLGFRQILAVIGDGERNHASVKLHERAGFRHAGRLEASGYKHGRWLDTVLMQLTLNGGGTLPPDPASLPEQRLK